MTEALTAYGEAAVHVMTTVGPAGALVLGGVEVVVGGPAAVVSLQAALLGHPSRLVGVVGDDGPGTLVRAELTRHGVDVTDLVTTGRSARIIAVIDRGDAALIADPGSGWAGYPARDEPPDPPPGLAYITGFPDMAPAIRSLGRRGHRLVVDVGFVPLLADPPALLRHVASIAEGIAVCVVSAAGLTDRDRRAVAEVCLAGGASVVLATLGGEGVLVTTADDSTHLPGHRVPVVDPLCAGDSFVGGYLCGVREGLDPVAAARFGQAVAATKVGLFGRLPARAEVEQTLRSATAAI